MMGAGIIASLVRITGASMIFTQLRVSTISETIEVNAACVGRLRLDWFFSSHVLDDLCEGIQWREYAVVEYQMSRTVRVVVQASKFHAVGESGILGY